MDVLPTTCYESVKRYWRRRKYQRVVGGSGTSIKRKLKIVRLGGGGGGNTQVQPPSVAADNNNTLNRSNSSVFGLFGRSKSVKSSNVVSVASTGEEVDTRTVMEIYTKFASSRARQTGIYV